MDISQFDFQKVKKAYFIGIKGSGMVALAEILLKQGIEIVGSDTAEIFFSDKILRNKLKVKVYEGFTERNIRKEEPFDLVVYSTAYNPQNNQELKYVQEKKYLAISYPQALGMLTKEKLSIIVCGTHGKTTTTAMLALAMQAAGAKPTAVVGSRINQVGSNALIGDSDFLVLEADEYQNKLQYYHPWGVVLTNLDYDHPDYFKDFESYKQVFKELIKRIPRHGFLVAWGESADVLEVVQEASCKIILYGRFSQLLERQQIIEDLKKEIQAVAEREVEVVTIPSDLYLTVPGKHNLLNATAVWAVCQQLKLNKEQVLAALRGYKGTARRFEKIGEYQGAVIIDDYAHHPEEIKATLAAAREQFPHHRLICVFHPHTFTRTKALLMEFAQSFDDCDQLIILDIYGSAREQQGGIHSKDLVAAVAKFKSSVEYIPTIEVAFKYLRGKLKKGDVLITMGAGNVNELAEKLVAKKGDFCR